MRVLFLTHRLPYAPNRGDRVRAFHLLAALRQFADVDLISLVHDDEEWANVRTMEWANGSVTPVRVSRLRSLIRSAVSLPGSTPLSHVMLDGPELRPAIDRVVQSHPPDVVVCFCTGIAHAVTRPPLAGVPLVLDMVDVDSAKWAALAQSSGWPKSWIYSREARLLGAFEIEITRRAFATILTTDRERETLQAMAPDARIEVMQNGVDADHLRPTTPPAASSTVVFCGVMNYPPNEEGAVWLVREVWPLVRRVRPDARLELVGSMPTALVQQLASESAGIVVTGHVDDVRPYLWNAAVATAPLLTARGVQNKVLEAAAAGLPVVITPTVGTGVPPEVLPACDVADDPEAFADAIARGLALAPGARRERASSADTASITWERRFQRLQDLVSAARGSRVP